MSYKLEIVMRGPKNNTVVATVTDGIFSTEVTEFEFSIFDGGFQEILKDYEALVAKIVAKGEKRQSRP